MPKCTVSKFVIFYLRLPFKLNCYVLLFQNSDQVFIFELWMRLYDFELWKSIVYIIDNIEKSFWNPQSDYV